MKKQLYFYLLFAALGVAGCKGDELRPEAGEELAGGATTTFNVSDDAFSFEASNLTGAEALEFFTGNSYFNQSWVTAPASTTSRDGLGPLFNEVACSNCHFKDGRGRPPAYFGETGHGFLMRLSITGTDIYGDPLPDPNYGGQLNNRGILGVAAEGEVEIIYTEIGGQYADGTPYSLRQPQYILRNLAYGAAAADLMMSPRVANQMIGLGLLEAIDLNDILARSDEQDSDGDGISGRPNYIYEVEMGAMRLGRFGWKANKPSLRQQVAGAFLGDIGISSSIFPNQNCTSPQQDCQDAANGNNAQGYELDDVVLDRVTLYSAALGVPARRNWDAEEVLRGKAIFMRIGCESCHRQKYTTASHDIAALSYQTIYPYTDLLLHDMGDGLSDGRPDGLATGKEWRTPPLWGLGLVPTVNGHSFYLHDGRARNLEEAVLWHGGEGENSQKAFVRLSASERADLIAFLKSL